MSATYIENVLSFECQGECLVGIVTAPSTHQSSANTAVIIVVGGPQYRAGSHRQFVQLARSLAQSGITSLRFDYRGMGDSSGAAQDFLSVTPDIRAAIDALLLAQPGLQRVVLWGLCDGASASLLYCDDSQDGRVCGLALLNPWVRSQESLARTQIKHYYLHRLRQPEFWRKLLSGKVALSALSGLTNSIRMATSKAQRPSMRPASFQDRMARAATVATRPVLLILSGKDYTAKEFLDNCLSSDVWGDFLAASHLDRRDIPSADHTFSEVEASAQVSQLTRVWLHNLNRQA